MSGVVILGKDSSNNVLKPVELSTAGLIKCEVSDVSTATHQQTQNSSLSTIATNTTGLNGCVVGTELQVVVDSSALPTGGATSINQGTAITSLSNIETNTALGASNKAGSLSVTLATDQGALSVSAPALSVSQDTLINNASVADGATEISSVLDMRTSKCVAIYGVMSDTSGELKLLVGGTSAGTYYEVNSVYIATDFSTGEFGIFLDNVGGSYLKVSYTNSSGTIKTISAYAEIKS